MRYTVIDWPNVITNIQRMDYQEVKYLAKSYN